MRELSQKEHRIQKALGLLEKFRVTIEKRDGSTWTFLCSITVEAENQVDALHKAWKKKRK